MSFAVILYWVATLLKPVASKPPCVITPLVTTRRPSEVNPQTANRHEDRSPVWGIADTHAHQFANLSAGGAMFWGASFSPKGSLESGIEYALPTCEPAHGQRGFGDIVGNLLRGHIPFLTGHNTHGYNTFEGWPTWDTQTHQQMYVSWLERAYEGGLRLIVMHAVNAEGLCHMFFVGKPIHCDDSTAIELQLTQAMSLQDYVDRESGGVGRGWYRIVRTPEEARRVIREGKLAVVLGIEVDNILDCRDKPEEQKKEPCDRARISRGLERYYDMGVRHIFPIHLANNAFGGFSLYHPYFDLNNKKLTGHFPGTEACPSTDSLTYRQNTSPVLALFLAGSVPHYKRQTADCNSEGLTALGAVMLEEMMKRGMIIDIDHMSRKALGEALRFTSSRGYPVIAGHTGFSEISLGQENHEGQKTAHQLEIIKKLHGMVSVIFVQGSTDDIAQWKDPGLGLSINNDCGNSSKTWAQAYLYAVSKMGGFATASVGMASDQMLNKWFGPRFGAGACSGPHSFRDQGLYFVATGQTIRPQPYPFRSGKSEQSDSVEYRHGVPLDSALYAHGVIVREVSFGLDSAENREFNFNTMGMAHIGLLPDFLRDLRNIGLTGDRLDPLFRSAEAYLEMWECAEQRAQSIKSPTTSRSHVDLCA